MGRIGLIDVDGHNFPNLALMRISAYHKSIGDTVEWWWSDLEHYDIVYKSKIFSDAYTKDVPDPFNADKIYKGGTGYCISLGEDGREHFDTAKNNVLPDDIERMFPDYSIYPQYDYAIAMTSRGCPRGCSFCHVQAKEGKCSTKVANVSDFYAGQKLIQVCDPNITACKDKRELFQQYKETGARIDFNQGLDIRLLNEEDIADLKQMKLNTIHFAWDNPKEDLKPKFKMFAEAFDVKSKAHGRNGMVYCLTNYNSTMEENLYRIYTLRDLGFDPYVMVYDKPHAPQEIKNLQRWVNNKIIFYSTKRFEEYVDKYGKGIALHRPAKEK